MEPVILRKYDSDQSSYVVGDQIPHFLNPGEVAAQAYANMSAMVTECDKVPAGDVNIPIYQTETKTKGTGEYQLTEAARKRIASDSAAESAAGLPISSETESPDPNDYVEKRVKVKVKRVVSNKTIKKYKYETLDAFVNQSYNSPKKDESNLVAIVIKNPKYAMPTRNQDFLSVFF